MKGLFAALPLLLALAHLFDVVLTDHRLVPAMSAPAFLVIVWWPIATWAIVRVRAGTQRALRASALATCFVAPLSVFASWAVMPGPFYGSPASFDTFMFWLTKHPNVGPINYEVLGGIVCVLCASLLPWFFGAYVRLVAVPPRRALFALLAIQVIAHAALFVKLDAAQLLYGALMIQELPTFGASFLGGALGRIAATASMALLCVAAGRQSLAR